MSGVVGAVGGEGSSILARAVAGHRRAVAERGWAVAEHRRVMEQQARIQAQHEQRLIDAEVRSSRRALIGALRRRAGPDVVALLDEDFLTVADSPTIYRAVLDAAVTVGGAESADLQLQERAGVLSIVTQHGFSAEFLAFFATVDAAQPTACAKALATRRPVLVDDVRGSTIFAGQPTLKPLVEAGTRSVHSYPLITSGEDVIGILSFHYRKSAPASGRAELVARCAAEAMMRMPSAPRSSHIGVVGSSSSRQT
jgi:GAF domain-containing protein